MRCDTCNTPDHGWGNVRVIETEDGLTFCSETCLERWESENDTRLIITRDFVGELVLPEVQ